MRLQQLLEEVRACTRCEEHLPLGPRPLLAASPRSRVLIIGQAPGARTHESGTVWDDASGDRLRDWLGVEREVFYDADSFAHVPMGFCYPGKASSGDAPPRPECAPLWHERLLAELKEVRLTLLIGKHAIASYAPEVGATLTEAVRAWRDTVPERLVLPHPSPRNNIWLKKNPWFSAEVLPVLRDLVRLAIAR